MASQTQASYKYSDKFAAAEARGNIDMEPLSPSKREISIDMLRGFAVLLMILTHAISFFHIGNDPLITNIGLIGGTLSFGLFLFLSGAAAYFSYVGRDFSQSPDAGRAKRQKILTRTIGLLIGYYIVAIAASLPTFSFPPNLTWVDNISKIIFFYNVPQFTEFIIAFVIFNLSLIPFHKVYRFLVKRPLLLILTGIFLYVVGSFMVGISTDGVLLNLKALIVGEGDLHRFPILQYAIVYLLGMSWGRFLTRFRESGVRIRVSILAGAASLAMAVMGTISFGYLNFAWMEPLKRFPPSITFLLWALAAGYFLYAFITFTGNLKFLGAGQVGLHYMGVNAFNFFTFHVLLLFIYQFVTGDKHFESSIIVIILFLVLLGLTAILSALKDNLIEGFKADSGHTEGFGWLLSERLIVSMVWVMIILLCGMAVFQNRVSGQTLASDQVLFKKRLIREEQWPYWYDHSYNYFQQIFIEASKELPISQNTWYEFHFDHAALVKANKSQKNGADIRIVYYDENQGAFGEIPFVFDGINGNATVKFKLQHDIQAGEKNDKYFLYYGNPDVTNYPAAKETPLSPRTDGITLATVYTHQLTGAINRKWVLKQGSGLSVKTLLFTVTLDNNLSDKSIVSYKVDGTDIRGQMSNLGNRKYQASVKASDLAPGVFKLQAIAREPDNKIKLIESGYTTFYVSYPIYVVWSMDWEGWDVPDANLNGLNEMANRYGIPMTHFFNPRIFVPSVMPKSRADQLTLWVLNRNQKYQDEIGMHMHMFYDMVRAAGVTPRTSDYAPWLYGDGGGVAAYAYPVNEMKQILEWGRRTFQDNGLPTPTAFRAGGWLAKENTLQALAETGFVIDSSGRTAPSSARQKAFPPPWNLSPTQAPYRPNINNINSDSAPHNTLWEFPNNGADSYWYDAKELINRFDLNYPNKNGVLTKPQVLIYLSHPPFYNIDKPKMEQVFSYIKNYLNRDDHGPVLYSTIENAYAYWDKSQ
jgi:hypothetical protein